MTHSSPSMRRYSADLSIFRLGRLSRRRPMPYQFILAMRAALCGSDCPFPRYRRRRPSEDRADRPALGRIAYCVVQEIDERPLRGGLVQHAANRRRRRLYRDALALLFRQYLQSSATDRRSSPISTGTKVGCDCPVSARARVIIVSTRQARRSASSSMLPIASL
jgi:hypothetical protein